MPQTRGQSRKLAPAQRVRLDTFKLDYKVVGWDERAQGPLLRSPDGGYRALTAAGKVVPRSNSISVRNHTAALRSIKLKNGSALDLVKTIRELPVEMLEELVVGESRLAA